MAISRLLLDNDVFILLATSDLLDEVAEIVGVEVSQFAHLGTLPYVLESRKHRDTFPRTIVTKILQNCKQVPVIAEQPNAILVQTLLSARNIDEGEAILYAHLAHTSTYLLTTNDKRAMRAVAQQPELQEICSQVCQRVICFETLLLRLVAIYGATTIAARFTEVLPNNGILRTVFTANNLAHPDQCIEGIESYLRLLIAEVGAGFLWQG